MRGEGNHKIPGSFAPENMEKTGAERVKYSLACQHEDAISIKFVSYAQKCPTVLCTFAVALRKESVDRNFSSLERYSSPTVALRKESVDRNAKFCASSMSGLLSLSARRAWIEIRSPGPHYSRSWVALRKESVDRNLLFDALGKATVASLSARRAWIEIFLFSGNLSRRQRRSPQGERG